MAGRVPMRIRIRQRMEKDLSFLVMTGSVRTGANLAGPGSSRVMAGLVPAIHDFLLFQHRQSWMAGPSPMRIRIRLRMEKDLSFPVMARLVRGTRLNTFAATNGPGKPA